MLAYPPRGAAPHLVQKGISAFAPIGDAAVLPDPRDAANDEPALAAPLRIAMIGTFAPRKCGIATFTADVRESILAARPDASVDIWPILPPGETGEHSLTEGDCVSFQAAAHAIDRTGADLVILQHEFGLFGGKAGDVVLDFVSALACPLAVTFHTVLAQPDADQRRVMDRLLSRSSKQIVMSQRSRILLRDVYGVPDERIEVIEHGVPDRPFGRGAMFKQRLGVSGPLLLTFGLLGPGKGIENAIKALPAIAAAHPDATYCIAGATHPNLLAREGEAYRNGLLDLAEGLGVSDRIRWVNRFLEQDELLDLIEAADIYLTPYPGAAQSTSGTLAYAVALGKAVISTPYVHAQELLSDDHGVLVPFNDSAAIAEAANALLADPARLQSLQHRAYARGRTMTWRRYGAKLVSLSEALRATPERGIEPVGLLPLEGVVRLTDDCGILQHGMMSVPDRNHGYCIDDNSRALLLMNRVGNAAGRPAARLATVYAAFMNHAWNDERGRFRNFMDYSRRWLEDEGSEDSNGRALWVLGATTEECGDARLRKWAAALHDRAMAHLGEYHCPRATAFAMLGAAHRLATEPEHEKCRETLERGGALLHALLEASRRPDWAWFETVLSYDNARLPEAMIRAGHLLDRPKWVDEGLDTLRWIVAQQTSPARLFRPVGTEGFGRELQRPMPFDQQPLEAWATIDACLAAHEVSAEPFWIEAARTAYDWYSGGNDRGVPIGDANGGTCNDGLTPTGPNLNSGAESVLAFHLATVSMRQLLSGARQPG